ncbi:MAG TPA: uracil-DNA glycosylase [Anaerolineaceae bacterium]|nr:uracil-DNA glycosylase [Anaerolineaceae bacterium]
MNLNDEIINCQRCERLVEWREEIAKIKKRAYLDWDYWGKPVPGFGDIHGQVLVVGLAPGAHGSNRTGRMFTGDSSGDFLYPALFKAGFASQPDSHHVNDGMQLTNMYITAICRCVPPQNKPTPEEIRNCNPYLRKEISQMNNLSVIVSLGALAHHQLLKIYSEIANTNLKFPFAHGKVEKIAENMPFIISSYHPSRQNTQTGKLTKEMFDTVWNLVNQIINSND